MQINPVLSNDNWSYYVHDHLGNTRVVLDDAGGVKSWYDYYPYGLIQRASIAGSDARFKFTGKEFDSEDDFDSYYFGARYYDPTVARWLSVDPRVIDRPSESPYSYTGNNPINRYDPDGEYWIVYNNGQYKAYGYPLKGTATLTAVGFVPLAGLITNSIKRFGFSDYGVNGLSWALAIFPVDKYSKGIEYLFTGAGTFDDIRQSQWDAQTFSLATKLGLGTDNSGALLSLNLDNIVAKLKADNPGISNEVLRVLIDKELGKLEDFFQLDKEVFVDTYDEETYNKYKAAQEDDSDDRNNRSNGNSNDWWDDYDPSKR